jgi:hypothetical protein
MPDTIEIRWKGKRLPKVVDLPVPFISYSEGWGQQVICDPVGEFPYEQGKNLLKIEGADGLWEEANPANPCECGCGGFANVGKRFIQGHHFTGGARPKSDAPGEDSQSLPE